MDSLILKTVTRLLIPFIQLYGFFVIFNGHLSPGGGFAGGTIIGSSLVLYALAYGHKKAHGIAPHKFTSMLETGGILGYIGVGLIGVVLGKPFLTNLSAGIARGNTFSILSSGLILLISIAIGIKVASTVVTLFFTITEEEDQ